MATLFGQKWTRNELLDHVGDLSQLISFRQTESISGPTQGAGFIDLQNSSGLHLTLLPGRCMDIAQASFKGIPLCYRGPVGDVGPAFYEPVGEGWMRGFFGGLLTTCGLTYVGEPAIDTEEEAKPLGLHGRISFTPARQISVDEGWEGDEYFLTVRGCMREGETLGTCLEMTRRITIQLGAKNFKIEDKIENLSRTKTTPLMVIYHTNPGFPLLDEGARLVLPSRRTTDCLTGEEVELSRYSPVGPLRNISYDEVYIHDLEPDQDGYVQFALLNDRLCGGLGLYWRYKKEEMPILNHWEHLVAGEHVIGIEPGNCSVAGREANRKAGTLQYIEPGEVRRFHLEMGVLEGQEDQYKK